MKPMSLALLTLLVSPWCQAADDYSFVEVKTSGSGCTEGTGSITFSPDNKVVSIINDQYQVQAPGLSGELTDRKNCKIEVLAKVQSNVRIEGLEASADFRGAVSVEEGSRARFSANFSQFTPSSVRSIASNSSLAISKSLYEFLLAGKIWQPGSGVSINEDWQYNIKRTIKPSVECSKYVQYVKFNINTSAVAEILDASNPLSFSLLTVDSADLNGQLKLKLNSLPCSVLPIKIPPLQKIPVRIPNPDPGPLKNISSINIR